MPIQKQTGYQVIPWPKEVTPVYDDQQGTVPWDELVIPAAQLPKDQWDHYMWVPTYHMARRWLKLHNLYQTMDRVLPPPTDQAASKVQSP